MNMAPRRRRTSQRCIVFNPVMQVEVREVKAILIVVPLQHICREIWHEEAEARSEIVCGSNLRTEFIELDVLSIAGQNTYRF